jgi:hypothetical protein
MREIDVIRQTRAFLRAHGLLGHALLDLYTDAHPALLADRDLQPFQRFTLAFEGFSVHPDLVGRLADGETTFAVEAKGVDDLLRGIAQADSYRAGFHLVLFASAGTPSRDLVALARQRDVGVLAVRAGHVEVLDLPPPHLPRLNQARSIRAQFAVGETLSRQFAFNLPTHYLCFAPVLQGWQAAYGPGWADLAALEAFTRERYPALPAGRASFRAALAGAEKLGIVGVRGRQAQPSFVGRAVAALLPGAPELAEIHRRIAARGSLTLADASPPSAAVLRTLLYADPVARFLIDVLGDIGPGVPSTMRGLVLHSAERDRALTRAIFFLPEAAPAIADDQGHLVWRRVEPRHFRSATFFQYKSILKHAGILAPHALGGASTRGYDPDADVWELRG